MLIARVHATLCVGLHGFEEQYRTEDPPVPVSSGPVIQRPAEAHGERRCKCWEDQINPALHAIPSLEADAIPYARDDVEPSRRPEWLLAGPGDADPGQRVPWSAVPTCHPTSVRKTSVYLTDRESKRLAEPSGARELAETPTRRLMSIIECAHDRVRPRPGRESSDKPGEHHERPHHATVLLARDSRARLLVPVTSITSLPRTCPAATCSCAAGASVSA